MFLTQIPTHHTVDPKAFFNAQARARYLLPMVLLSIVPFAVPCLIAIWGIGLVSPDGKGFGRTSSASPGSSRQS